MSEKARECRCQDCGRSFLYGTEGDNEKFCLRCERIALLTKDEDFDIDEEE